MRDATNKPSYSAIRRTRATYLSLMLCILNFLMLDASKRDLSSRGWLIAFCMSNKTAFVGTDRWLGMIESRMNPVYAVRKRPRKDIKTEIVSARPKSRVADSGAGLSWIFLLEFGKSKVMRLVRLNS